MDFDIKVNYRRVNMTACPAGWRLPTREDWNDLVREADGRDAAGGRLKSRTGWSYYRNGTDNFGFSALPGGGYRHPDGRFSRVGSNGFWWSATENGSDNAWSQNMSSGHNRVINFNSSKSTGYSVRCVQK